MKPLYRCPLIKKIAIAELSIGSVGSLVYCSASGEGPSMETVWAALVTLAVNQSVPDVPIINVDI